MMRHPRDSRSTSSTTQGPPVDDGDGGYLVITEPWPAHASRHLGRPASATSRTYWTPTSDGLYFAGDGAKKDLDGDLWLLGASTTSSTSRPIASPPRRSSTRSSSHPWVAEAAVVGAHDEITGQAVVAFVIIRDDAVTLETDGHKVAVTRCASTSRHEIGALARPRDDPRREPRCRRRDRARSCAACCATSRSTARSAT